MGETQAPLPVSPLPLIHEISLSEGKAGNLQTVEFMKRVARQKSRDPIFRQLALKIIEDVPSNHFKSEALEIGRWVLKNIRYVRDADNIEQLIDPTNLVNQYYAGTKPQGDCDDMALLTATLLLTIGVQPYFRAIRYEAPQNGEDNYNHIYVVAYENNPHEPKQRIVLDCILKDRKIGQELPHHSGDEFEV